MEAWSISTGFLGSPEDSNAINSKNRVLKASRALAAKAGSFSFVSSILSSVNFFSKGSASMKIPNFSCINKPWIIPLMASLGGRPGKVGSFIPRVHSGFLGSPWGIKACFFNSLTKMPSSFWAPCRSNEGTWAWGSVDSPSLGSSTAIMPGIFFTSSSGATITTRKAFSKISGIRISLGVEIPRITGFSP